MPETFYSTYINRNSLRYRVWKRTFQGTTSTIESITTPKFVGQEVKIGYKDTDWRLKVAKKEDASSPYTRKVWEQIVPHYLHAHAETRNATGNKAYQNYVRTEFSNHSLAGAGNVDSALQDRALGRLKSKLSNEYLGNARLAIPVAELRELRKSIKDAASHTEVALRTLLTVPRFRRNHRRFAEFTQYVQSAWLQWSFGVAPMIADTMSALEAVDNYLDRPKELIRIRSSATKEWIGGTHNVSGNQDGWSTDVTAHASYKLQYAYVAGIDFSVLSSNNYKLSDHLGFSGFAQQVPALVWELTAFSWVLDYFTTVGAYMNDTFVLPPGSTVYLNCTRKYTSIIEETCALVKATNPAGWYNHYLPVHVTQPGYAKYVEIDRTVLNSLPRRSMRVKSLDEIGSNAVNKLLNLGALLKVR